MTYDQTTVLTAMIEAAQGVSFDESKIRVWYSLLDDIDFEVAKIAVGKLLRTSTYSITPAHIRAACADIVSPQINVEQAWSQLWTLVKPPNSPPSYDWEEKTKHICPVVLEIYHSIGNFNIFQSEERFFRPQFEKLYKSMANSKKEGLMLSGDISAKIADLRIRLATVVENDEPDYTDVDDPFYADFLLNG